MFTIDKMSRTPLYEQLIEQFESCIISGDIGPDGKLPSVRQLSRELNVNPNTLQRAYNEIERRGLCYTVPGNGRYLTKDAMDKLHEAAEKKAGWLESILNEFKNRGIAKETLLEIVNNVYDEKSDMKGKVDGK